MVISIVNQLVRTYQFASGQLTNYLIYSICHTVVASIG